MRVRTQRPSRPSPRGRRIGPWAAGFDIQGHRGAKAHLPESTWPGFLRAVELGSTSVEFDVRLTGDGDVVVWHDATLARADPALPADVAQAWIADLPTSVVVGTAVRPGSALILRLRDLLTRLGEQLPSTWAVVEVKVDHNVPGAPIAREALVDAVLADIAATGFERAVVHSFDWAVLERARRTASHLPRSALVEAKTLRPGSPWLGGVDPAGWRGPRDVVAAAVAAGADALAPNWQWPTDAREPGGRIVSGGALDAAFVEAAHDAGLPVVPWTVNDPAQIARLIDLGVDGIVSDSPELVTQALTSARRPSGGSHG